MRVRQRTFCWSSACTSSDDVAVTIMLVLNISARHPTPRALRRTAAVLRRSGVIVYPTDTAYALGGRYDSPSVIRRVLAIKGRQDRKFTLVAASLAQVARHFRLPTAARRLALRYWPGPLSIAVSSRFAVRVPASRVARTLARLAGAPLIATSANRAGGQTPYTVREVTRQLGSPLLRHPMTYIQPDLVIDAGRLPKTKPSTIIRVDGRGKVVVVRPGPINVSVKGKVRSAKYR